MASKTISDLHIDAALSRMSVRYNNAQMVGEILVPRAKVGKRSDKYFTYGLDNLRSIDDIRANGGTAKIVSQSRSSDSYSVDEHALKELVTWDEIDEADSPLDPKRDATENVTDQILLNLEKTIATALTATATMTNNVTLAGVNQWNDYTGSDPLGDLATGKQSVQANAIKPVNTVLFGQEVWNKLVNHPDVLDRIKHTSLGVVTTQLVAQLLEVDTVVVGGAMENIGVEGQTDNLSFVWGKNVVMAHVSPTPRPRSLSLGYLFSNKGRDVRDYKDEKRKGQWIEVSDYYDLKIVAVGAGYLIKDAVA